MQGSLSKHEEGQVPSIHKQAREEYCTTGAHTEGYKQNACRGLGPPGLQGAGVEGT